METGHRGLRADEVAAILGYLRAPAALRQELVDLVRAGEHRNWHAIHGKLPSNWKDLIGFEAEATALYNYEPVLIPGLAQTPDYARAILQGTHDGLSAAELDTLVASRMGRQVVLARAQVHLLIDEGALRRHLGDPATMRAQLQHLTALTCRANIHIQVVPFDAGAHPGLEGPFVRLEFADQPSLVYVESRSTSTFLEEERYLVAATLAWQKLRALALSAGASADLMAKLAGKLT
jgi:hypothetical protein